MKICVTGAAGYGWQPVTSIEDGIRDTVRYLLKHPELMTRL